MQFLFFVFLAVGSFFLAILAGLFLPSAIGWFMVAVLVVYALAISPCCSSVEDRRCAEAEFFTSLHRSSMGLKKNFSVHTTSLPNRFLHQLLRTLFPDPILCSLLAGFSVFGILFGKAIRQIVC